jgi:phage-related protein
VANQVVLTFAGEEKPLTQSFDKVGAAAKDMDSTVGSASHGLDEHANGLEKVGSSADNAERNIIGVHDVIDGTATIMQGPGKQGIVAYLQGWADLAGGIAPMAEYLSKTKLATIGQAVAQKSAAIGAKVWAAAQWLMNSALLASPITWIVLGIVALVAVIVLIATKTTWFQRGWKAAWAGIKAAASGTWDFIKKIPGWIGSLFSTVSAAISRPFRAAFNLVATAWNNTIGRLSWSVPGWVPVIGGNSISVPNLPTFHSGGIVPGAPGTPTMALLQAGEKVSSIASSGGGDSGWVAVRGDAVIDALIHAIASRVANIGGRPAQLGIKLA